MSSLLIPFMSYKCQVLFSYGWSGVVVIKLDIQILQLK